MSDDDKIKVRMIVKFEVEPEVSVPLPPMIGQVDIAPNFFDKTGEDLFAPVFKHFAGSFAPTGEVPRLLGEPLTRALGEALQAWRARNGS